MKINNTLLPRVEKVVLVMQDLKQVPIKHQGSLLVVKKGKLEKLGLN